MNIILIILIKFAYKHVLEQPLNFEIQFVDSFRSYLFDCLHEDFK